MSNELDVFSEDRFQHAVKVAGTLAKSSIVPAHFRNKPEDVFATLVLGAELGFKPMQALNSIVMIQGNATLKAQTMLAIARAKVKDLSVNITNDKDSVTVTMKRGDDSYTTTWDDAKAGAMGLLGKDNYKKQKHTMYRWRAISEALKIMCSDVLMGLNTTEELEDLPQQRLTMSQQLKEDLDRDYPIPPEEKVVGPLYRVQHGTTMGGRQLKDFSLEEIESYLEKLTAKKNKLPWQTELCYVLTEYITNYDSYKEMLLELKNEV